MIDVHVAVGSASGRKHLRKVASDDWASTCGHHRYRLRPGDCGPTIAMALGDFGADVLKIENPAGGDQVRAFGRSRDDVSLFSKLISRNKRSVTLNLREPDGQDLLCRLVEATQADVLIESFRPGTLERWNLGYDRLSTIRPELVLVRVSGFGQSGPYADLPGFGTLAEAMSGFAHVTGQPKGPPTLPPFALADNVAALNAAFAVMVALYARDATDDGKGEVVDVSLFESMVSLLGMYLVEYDQLGHVGQRQGNRTGSAPRNAYATSDGRWLVIAASTQSIAERLFSVMGMPELTDDPRFASNRDRVANVEKLDEIVGAWVRQRTLEQSLTTLREAEVAVAPVLHAGDLADNAHLRARGSIVSVSDEQLGSIRMPDVQPTLERRPGRVRHAGPALGSSTDEVLSQQLGLTGPELDELRQRGVI